MTTLAAATLGERAGHRLLDNYITEDELWACTSCRACVQECPVSIDQLDVINELRRNLVLTESRFPEEIQPAFEAMERNGAPWKFQPADRGRWADGLGVTTMAEFAERNERPDVLFWVGCMGVVRRSREEDRRRVRAHPQRRRAFASRSSAQEESCNGDPARRMGNEYLYQMLARQAIETLDRYQVTTIVTTCPHCFHQIGNEYPQLGGNYEVIHHSTYIERLLEQELRAAPHGERQAARRRVSRQLLSRSLQRRLRCAARDAQARAARRDGRRAAAQPQPGPVLRRGRRSHVDGRAGREAHQRRAHRGAARHGRGRAGRRVPVLHDDDLGRREGAWSEVPVYDIAEVVAGQLKGDEADDRRYWASVCFPIHSPTVSASSGVSSTITVRRPR